jgi:2-polyprenyl-6-methoxyphenol hydroxylase-like FAD-dependent oxidoreductase
MRVLIIGAGVAGTTLALFLRQAGIECAVYERAAAGGSGVALAVATNGLAVLEAAGVLEQVEQVSVRAMDWAFENQDAGVLARIPDARRNTRAVLQQILEKRAVEQGIAIHYGKSLTGVVDEPGKPIVAQFADGTSAEGDCLIGADGLGSQVRRCILPETPRPAYSGLMAPGGFSPCPPGVAAAAGSEQRVHLIFGRECFFEYLHVTTPDGPRTLWWSTAEAPLLSRSQMASVTKAEWQRRLLDLHRDWASPVPQLIDMAESIVPVAIHDFPLLPRWSAGRSLVIGDAAHAVGPHSGQASSMALEDAWMLGRCMRSATPAKLTAIFQRFERERRPRVERVLRLGQRAAKRKVEMTPFAYWRLQQMMRIRVPIGSWKSKRWLLDYRVPPTPPV